MCEPLKILQWNAASLYSSKLQEFKNDLNKLNPSIVVLSETYWKDNYKVKLDQYNIFYLNRQDRRGGGVAILVKKSIPATLMDITQTPSLEVIGVTCILGDVNLDIVSVYCPHGNMCEAEDIQRLFDVTGENAIVAGDFNAHSHIWKENVRSNRAGHIIESYLLDNDKFSLSTPRNLKTRRNARNNRVSYSTIDLTFITANLAQSFSSYSGPMDWSSDHIPVISELALNYVPEAPKTPAWTFHDHSWPLWNSDLEDYFKRCNFSNIEDPVSAFEEFYAAIYKASDRHFSSKRASSNKREPTKPWWNKACQQAVSKARKARRNWLKNPNNQRLKTELNRLEARKKKILLKASREAWANHIESLETTKDKKKFWNFVNVMNNKRSPLQNVPINDPDGGSTKDDVRKAEIFLNHYFPADDQVEEDHDERTAEYENVIEERCRDDGQCALNDEFSLEELSQALKNLPSKAVGADRIHNRMLTNLTESNRKSLLKLLNLSYTTGFVPEQWKSAIVVPILKPGKPANEADSYRPISLTSCLAKLKEKLINNRLKWFLDKSGLIPSCQAGFRSGYTTMDHVVRLESTAVTAMNRGKITSAVFLDLKKAYDVTWITGLLLKASRLGLKGKILRWLKNFLSGRKAQVRIGISTSGFRILVKGLPQGGVLSPTLFIIYMYDFPSPRLFIRLSLFADDIEFDTTQDSTEEAQFVLQGYLYDIDGWAVEWRMTFTVSKCVSLTFSRRTREEAPVRLTLGDEPIGIAESFKFLGVYFNRRLDWKTHIDNLARSLTRSGFIIYKLVNMKQSLSVNLLVRLYKALLRSKLDYGAPVLVSALKTHPHRLEVIQNRFLRTILGGFKSTPVNLLQLETGISSIKNRWTFLATTHYIKLSKRPANPAYKAVHDTLRPGLKWKPRSKPAVVHVKEYLRSLQQDIFTAPPAARLFCSAYPPWHRPPITIKFFPMNKKQASGNPTAAANKFAELMENVSEDHTSFYTDGSVDPVDQSAGCGLHCPERNINKSWSLSALSNIHTCELIAILKALSEISSLDPGEFTIFTDSASSLQTIQNPKLINELVDNIWTLLQICTNSSRFVTLAWVPSHVGIVGNTEADSLASAGRTDPSEGRIHNVLSASELISPFKSTWNETIFQDLKSKHTKYDAITKRPAFGPVPWHTHKNRRLQVALFRLRSTFNKLQGCVGSWTPDGNTDCPHCPQNKEDAEHVLLNCPEYSTQRLQLRALFYKINQQFTTPSILGLGEGIPNSSQLKIQSALCRFLCEAELLGRI